MRSSAMLKHFISTVLITALLLSGAVPSFNTAQIVRAAETDSTAASETESTAAQQQARPPKINGTSAQIMDLTTGTVVYEKNAAKVREPASLTKIMTCLVILETMDLDQEVTVPENVETEGSVIGLMPGEKLPVEELLYGMMLGSGNDAAQVLAIAAGGNADKFCDQMNERAKACGAENTVFRNPNGLNEDPKRLNRSSAKDLALISREAMSNPKFREIVGTAKHTIPATNMSEARKLENTNLCLWLKTEKIKVNGKEVPYKYEGCNGIKTGMTSDAGHCFIGSAVRDGSEFLVVVLNSEDEDSRFRDGIKLWDYAFDQYRTQIVQKAGTVAGVQKVRRGALRKVDLGTTRDLSVTVQNTGEDEVFTTEFRLDESKLTAPVKAGQKVGSVIAFDSKGKSVAEEELFTLQPVEAGGPLSYIGIADEDLPLAGAAAAGILILLIIGLAASRSKRKKSRTGRKEEIHQELHRMRSSGTGMTPSELEEVTGKEEILPAPKTPARISREELDAWSDPGSGKSAKKPETGDTSDKWRERFSMKITPRDEMKALLEETMHRRPDLPRHHAGLTDEEMQELLSGKKTSGEETGKQDTDV